MHPSKNLIMAMGIHHNRDVQEKTMDLDGMVP